MGYTIVAGSLLTADGNVAQVFVAGATGRLGARIVKMLLEKNNQIKVRPNLLFPGSWQFLISVKASCIAQQG